VPVVAWGPRGSDVSVRGIAELVGQHPMTAAVLPVIVGILASDPPIDHVVVVRSSP
jgi:L-fuculose-phosphate aldolase